MPLPTHGTRPGSKSDAARRHQRRRDRALASGVCIRCAKQTPMAGRRICRTCRGRYELRRLTLIVGRKRARQYETDRRLKQRRLEAGQCPRCTAPLAFGRLSCADCLADKRAANRERKAHWAAGSKCLKCGHVREDPALLQCDHCRTQGYAYKKRYQADGFCQCGRFRAFDRRACAACLALRRNAQRRRRAGRYAILAVQGKARAMNAGFRS